MQLLNSTYKSCFPRSRWGIYVKFALNLKSLTAYLAALGKAIRDRRQHARLTQSDLVSAVHDIPVDIVSERSLAEETLSRIENGQQNLSIKQLFLIANALNTTPSELLSCAEALIHE